MVDPIGPIGTVSIGRNAGGSTDSNASPAWRNQPGKELSR